jgi:lipopolysaccharide transport system ATP-binding protein
MSEQVITVEKISKAYRIGARRKHPFTLRESLAETFRAAACRIGNLFRNKAASHVTETFWALREVCFDVKRGEVVGIIGRNGAGKSTLLKILSRITEPTEGLARLRGRVGSLLEVGTGFHSELTGRENIYFSGAILGMRKAEIDRKFDEIVAFAEVEKFLDTPIKYYSSGMNVRLGFAVAAHLESEILLVDEVLAVGDASFQKKCLGKMGQVAKGGRTVLFVSHNMNAVVGLCSKGILLDKGEVRLIGSAQEAVQAYVAQIESAATVALSHRTDREGNGRVVFTSFSLLDGDLVPTKTAQAGKEVVFAVGYRVQDAQPVTEASLEIGVYTIEGILVFLCGNGFAEDLLANLPPEGRILCRLPKCRLSKGVYDVNLYCGVKGQTADWIRGAAQFQVIEGDFYGTGRLPPAHAGLVLSEHSWQIEDSARVNPASRRGDANAI